MKRIVFKRGKQNEFLESVLLKSRLSVKKIAFLCNIHEKTFRGWMQEKTSMPYESAVFLSKDYSIKLPGDCEVRDAYWHAAKAGRKGGLVSQGKYGNPGTVSGRKLGGTHSVESNARKGTAFKQRKKIIIPIPSVKLAEMFGIILGDGAITPYQVNITLNNLVDKDYGNWIIKEFEKIFGIKAYRNVRGNTLCITISSIELVEFFVKNGLKIGDKINNKLNIPNWILRNREYSLACVRGLFDTDGCVYIDKHILKDKEYRNICLDYTSANRCLLKTVYGICLEQKLNFKIYNKSIKLRKEGDIRKFYQLIGTSNLKHQEKFDNFFLEKYGEVA